MQVIDDYHAVVDVASTILENKLTTLDIRASSKVIWPSSSGELAALRRHFETTASPSIRVRTGRCPPPALDLFSRTYVTASGSLGEPGWNWAAPLLVSRCRPGNERMPELHIECWTINSLEYRTRAM